MDIFTTLFVALGLAMDCFAVSLGIGTSRIANTVRPIFRLSFHFGLFQGLMTFLGWLAGNTIAGLIASFDHWIALVLLAWVGIRMIREGLSPDKDIDPVDPSRGKTLVMLSIATSIDALAVGLSMSLLKVDIPSASLVIGSVTLAVSLAGLLIGHQLGVHFGKRMEIVGGVILNLIGIRVLLSHIL